MGCAAGEQKAGNICAGDQQDEGGYDHQKAQGPGVVNLQIHSAAAGGSQREGEIVQLVLAVAGHARSLSDPVLDLRFEPNFRLCKRNTWFDPANRVEPIIVGIIEVRTDANQKRLRGQGEPQFGGVAAQGVAIELWSSDAGNSVRGAVDAQPQPGSAVRVVDAGSLETMLQREGLTRGLFRLEGLINNGPTSR